MPGIEPHPYQEPIRTAPLDQQPLLEIRHLKKYYKAGASFGLNKNVVKAVDDVSFHLWEGETYGLVGESGCGKSTLGKSLLRLNDVTSGEVRFRGTDILSLSNRALRPLRQQLQMVFQDPYTSLNPRKRIGSILEESLVIHGIGSRQEREQRIFEILDKVGLQPEYYYRYPHELSGGQRQRIGLARVLILNPKIVICDEPVSALDVIIQSQIINLLRKLQGELGLTYLFIAHDISVVRHISDRIGVMYLGKLVEEAETDSLFLNPQHPYTRALLSAVPIADPTVKRERIILKGDLPSPLHPPSGCVFHTRCPFVMDVCRQEMPILREVSPNHRSACHLQAEITK
ncbi:dipeptide ABC transporter ATP-binding protein [Paenibacillus sp. WQ 127069]|uniref:Dipeptide ABC transporter ATP-binding protein n=1 Tax=Paenibacillus baimaensis TaxID=2982185 RepID=A0ABT2UJJ4_9BACL|nr:dipeptide ABC transporter ATP-binding protein [Paenibacillus sp. WQ 127069]MCU6794301.1 dipeptide ABC transporter ATP-binding protein [Paenibacillus sp. WQ 127069]